MNITPIKISGQNFFGQIRQHASPDYQTFLVSSYRRRLMRSLFILPMLIFSIHAVANPASDEYNSMDDFLHQASLKNQKVLFHRTGDLNNDGLEDWAGILSKDNEDNAEEAPLIKLVVLIQLHSGHYAESASSMEVEDYYRFSPSSSFDFEIKNSSIYFVTSGHTCCEVSSSVYQFKLYKGTWRLVGKKISSGNKTSGENSDDDFSKVEDVNMLTGLTISTVVRGNKKDEQRFIKKMRVFLLKDFDFSGNYAAR